MRRRRNTRLKAGGAVKAYMALIVLVSLVFTIIPEALFASSWSPTLLANTEAFQVIDDTDSSANIQLKFGDGIGETLTYDRSNRRFKFSRGLFVGGNTVITGSLLVNIGNGPTTADTALEVPGIISGSTVYTKSFSGAGLTTCSNTTTSKLLWNSTTGQFSCGTDQTGGGGGSFGTGNVATINGSYVSKGGSTMTGALTVNLNSGTVGINAKQTISGSTLHVSAGGATIHGALSASGQVITDGDLTLNDDRTAAADATLTFGNATANQTLKFIHSVQRFKFSTSVDVVGTLSGTTVNANTVLTGATIRGFGLPGGGCSNSTTSKLLWNTSTGKFECGTDQGGAGSGLAYADANGIFVNQGGDTMTGGLAIEDFSGGNALTVSGGILSQSAYGNPVILSGANISAAVRTVYVSGKFAFVGHDSVSGHDLRIYDVHNRAKPTFVGGIDVGANVNVILRVGRYLYVGTSTVAGTCTRNVVTGCEFRVYDVTNMASALAVGGVDVAIGINDFQIIGELAYIANDTVAGTCTGSTGATLTGCEFRVYDVSNPYTPQAIGGINEGVDARGVYVQGGLAYLVYDSDSSTNSEFEIYSVANHSNIVSVGGVNAGVAALNFNSVIISGKYAYIGTSADASTCAGIVITGCEFRVYDVGNPTSPSAVGGLDMAISVNGMEIAGATVFAGLGSNAGTEVRTIDVSSPATPLGIAGTEIGASVNAVALAGKFIYAGSDTLAPGNEFHLLDGPGIESPTATIGNIQTSNLTVTEGARINNTLYVGNGLNVGRGGVNLRGPLSVQSTSTGSLFTGLDVKNLTGTTMFSVSDNGFSDSVRGAVSYNGYLAQEFNDEKASSTADSVAWGDDLTWVHDVSTTTCAGMVNENWPSAHRSQITAAGVGCNLYLGIAAGDPMNFISATGSLARVLIKMRVSSVATTQRSYAGLFVAAAANNVTEPTEGVYFTGSGATHTEWQGTINPLTGPSVYIRCPGATIVTGQSQYALLDISFESANRVRFRVDPNTLDGVNFINCGFGNPSGVKNFMGVGTLFNTVTGFSGTAQMDVDFIRVWSQ